MENVLFYTFSTIAAAFGSAVGIIVAAAIFRMQRIDLIAAGLCRTMKDFQTDEDVKKQIERIITAQHWSKFLKVWNDQHQSIDKKRHTEHKDYKYVLDKVIQRLDSIRNGVRMLVIATLILIFTCFVCLAGEPKVKNIMWCNINVPAAGAVLYASCLLIGYAYITLLLTKENDYD